MDSTVSETFIPMALFLYVHQINLSPFFFRISGMNLLKRVVVTAIIYCKLKVWKDIIKLLLQFVKNKKSNNNNDNDDLLNTPKFQMIL